MKLGKRVMRVIPVDKSGKNDAMTRMTRLGYSPAYAPAHGESLRNTRHTRHTRHGVKI